jgi:kynurenine formamidase
MRLIDLSLTIDPAIAEPAQVAVEYVDHRAGADILGQSHGLDHRDFPGALGLSLEHVTLTTHTGTHVDAPLHYGPLCEGRPATSIEGLPLSWFFGRGVRLRCPGTVRDGPVTLEEVRRELTRIGYVIAPYDIVLVYTGADAFWGRAEYFTHFRGMSREAASWLLDQGVKVIGIDSFGFDPPFDRMLSEYAVSGRSEALWPCHVIGRSREYCHIERLANLDALEVDHGFRVACFPIKIKACGAGWTRAVAILDEGAEGLEDRFGAGPDGAARP